MPAILTAPAVVAVQPFADLGEYCTYGQAVYSSTAIRHGLANVPTPEQYDNMVRVHDTVIVPIVNHFGIAPNVNSFFRSGVLVKKGRVWMSVNSAVGGSKTSDHPNGRAVDLSYKWVKSTNGKRVPTNLELFAWGVANISCDQLILEFADEQGNPAWCHFGQRGENNNRHQVFSAIKDKNGKTMYV